MDILDRIIMLMGSRDQKELTKYLQLNAVAFSDWKSGKSNSYKKYLIEIAKFFNVSIDYLVYGKTPDSSLRTDEEELLQNYNSVDIVAKAQIRERASVLAELEAAKKKNNVQTPLKQSLKQTETEEKQEPQYLSLPFPALPASAGAGEYLHEDVTIKPNMK